ncbi:helix-turn-helix transcriptional regulator [Paraburkholderia acidipaludis]|uniref:helix-turn-helix transcriptional regulator n=1 Tax=Paraburkholderia acidipaludis TaxID=660537 RepID=UPI0004890FE5|nr:helix-turn-helix domain-containing protein [Paraburkholderia acidipaludis]
MTHSETRILHVSTAGIPAAERFAWWRQAVCTVYAGIEPEPPGEPSFDGCFETLSFDHASIGRITAPGHSARRDAAALSRIPDDSVFINYCESSDYIVEDRLGKSVIPRRTPRLHDNAASFAVHFPERRRMTLNSLRLPRSAFGGVPSFAALNSALEMSPLGRLIGEQFQLVCQAMHLGQPRAAAALGRSLEALVLTLAQESHRSRPALEAPRTALEHLKNYAGERLSDPGLSAATVAEAFHCTSRTIQHRFANADETFSAWLLEERLLKARSMLREPQHILRSVEWIGYQCGFASAAHFHRAFKARFGLTPGRTRTLVPAPSD